MIYVVYVLICVLGFVAGMTLGERTGLKMAVDMMIAAGVAEMGEEENADGEN